MSELTKSPSSERGPKKNSVDLRARYWKFLFDNFQRAVDGIYQTCEQDESVVECKVCKLAACFPSDKIMKISWYSLFNSETLFIVLNIYKS